MEIPKNKRIYIKDWFDDSQTFKDGYIIDFEMPSFCSGDYEARIYIDNDGDPYINKKDNYLKSCRDYYIRETA